MRLSPIIPCLLVAANAMAEESAVPEADQDTLTAGGDPVDPALAADGAGDATRAGWIEHLGDPAVLGHVVATAVTLVLAVVVYVALRRGIDHLLKRNHQIQFLARRLLCWIYIPLVCLMLLQQMGVALGSLWTVISTTMAMVAIGFVAVWSMLSNVSATFMIFSTRMFSVGDEIEVLEPTAKDGLRGRVVDLNLLYTTIEHEPVNGKGRIVSKLPNNVFFQKALRVRYEGAELPEPENDTLVEAGAGKPAPGDPERESERA